MKLIYDKIFNNSLEKRDANDTLEMKHHKAIRRFINLRLIHSETLLKVILLYRLF